METTPPTLIPTHEDPTTSEDPCPGLEVSITQDGSPTLVDTSRHALGSGETMHSSSGALNESLHVYGPALEETLAAEPKVKDLHVCVVGLGLGYLEMMTAARVLAEPEARPLALRITSFEANPHLVDRMMGWLQGEAHPLLDEVCARVAASWPVIPGTPKNAGAADIRALLHKAQEAKLWTILGPLDRNFTRDHRKALGLPEFQTVLYDPYSARACPLLWEQDFVFRFLEDHCSPALTVFASYASRGSLKHSLRANEFHLIQRPGFGKKRESTLAIRTSNQTSAQTPAPTP